MASQAPQEENPRLSSSLLENLIYFRKEFDGSMDFVVREFKITGTDAALLSIDGMVNKQVIAESILNPILTAAVMELEPEQKMRYLRDNILSTVEQVQLVAKEDVIFRLMNGFAVLAIDQCDYMLSFGVQGFQHRSVSEPSNEVMQRGSREGFVEPLLVNMSMIRRRMKTPKLKFEPMVIGKDSKTNICLCYMRDMVSPEVLRLLKKNLASIQINTVLAAGYLSPFLEKPSIFNGVGLSERPDTVCGKINEGRVAIIVDGTPNVLLVPFLFVENFQSFDDYTTRPFYATLTRWLKYISFFISIFLPGMYVASATFHPEFLPQALLQKIAQAESQTPFSIFIEAIILHILYEIMREAGLRVPRPLSHAVSIVGALVIGDAAVSSGLVGSPTLMVIALTAIASYVTPNLYEPISLLRFIFIILGGTVGIWGMMLGFGFVLINICAESIYNIPFSAPLSPFNLHSMRDVLVRLGWKKLSKDEETVQNMPGSDVTLRGNAKGPKQQK
ncbi:MAG: spore germination protein [Clostridiales bacterium]|nr:spore germination protein [Clostridiales bacterium]